jgi:hypothetical protein
MSARTGRDLYETWVKSGQCSGTPRAWEELASSTQVYWTKQALGQPTPVARAVESDARTTFETQAALCAPGHTFARKANGEYEDYATQAAFTGWRLALAAIAQGLLPAPATLGPSGPSTSGSEGLPTAAG